MNQTKLTVHLLPPLFVHPALLHQHPTTFTTLVIRQHDCKTVKDVVFYRQKVRIYSYLYYDLPILAQCDTFFMCLPFHIWRWTRYLGATSRRYYGNQCIFFTILHWCLPRHIQLVRMQSFFSYFSLY
jgi:hypothetical protein